MRVNEIFVSVDGEVNTTGGQGMPTVFIRLQGCNLRCVYCDTVYAQDPEGGKEMSVGEVLDVVEEMGPKRATITGGEPLYQWPEAKSLIQNLVVLGYHISIETNGSLSVKGLSGGNVSVVMDYKLPSSGMQGAMKVGNFVDLTDSDYVKFVIADRKDYEEAKDMLVRFPDEVHVAFSPVTPGLPADKLLRWMKEDRLWDVQLNIQLHKVIGVK